MQSIPSSKKNKVVIIIGVSSHLGIKIAGLCLEKGWAVVGTYRQKNGNLNELRHNNIHNKEKLLLSRLDVLDASAIAGFFKELADRDRTNTHDITIIYCCGRWGYGDMTDLDSESFDSVIGVGLRGPFCVTANALRYFNSGAQIILVTGLGGEKNAIASNALYSITTTGVYNLVRAVGEELAGMESMCIGVALGLFDKGQAYATSLAKYLNHGELESLTGVSVIIASLIETRNRIHNGTVIELTGGLLNYRKVIDYFKTMEIKK